MVDGRTLSKKERKALRRAQRAAIADGTVVDTDALHALVAHAAETTGLLTTAAHEALRARLEAEVFRLLEEKDRRVVITVRFSLRSHNRKANNER
jgi:hypothetical protein